MINDELVVGGEGEGTLLIEKGGLVAVGSDDSVYIGDMPGSTGTVTVTGGDVYDVNEDTGLFTGSYQERSQLISEGPIYVGVEGKGTLLIEDGASVESDGGFIGWKSGSTGSSVTVTGQEFYQESPDVNDNSWRSIPGSRWINDGQLVVGGAGNGTLLIEDGGYVESHGAIIGLEEGISGSVTVTGPEVIQDSLDLNEDTQWDNDGSQWINKGPTVVGWSGDGVMDVNDGGRVTSYSGSIGKMRGSTGSVTVDGENSSWRIWGMGPGDLYVGDEGDGTLMISNGGQVSNGNAYIAADLVSTGSVTVTGPNSVWENNGDLYVGGWEDSEEDDFGIPTGGEAVLLISDGGSVESDDGYIGTGELARGSVTVTGPNSVWENDDELVIGRYEGYGVMDVNDGGRVTSYELIIGQDGGYGTMDVNDGKVTSKLLSVGENGGEGEMFISNGGDVTNEVLGVGHNGYGTLLISNGGTMESDMAYIGTSDDEDEARARGSVTVTGEDSAWDINGGLYVGHGDGEGKLLISDGGKVTSKEAHIGTDFDSSGLVTVTGPNSVWDNKHGIQVGGERGYYEEWMDAFGVDHEEYYPAGPGVLNISDGAVVKAGSVMIAPGGILSGDGTLVSDYVSNEGTIKPGNSIGTLTINGNLEIHPDSVYEVEIDNSGNSDLLKVNGDVDIVGGIVQAVSTETITGAQHYMIIEANNVDGEFDTLDTALLDLTMSYSDIGLGYEPNAAGPDLVMLNIDAKRFDDPSIAQNGNQSSLGGALQKIADGGGSPITTALQGLETDDQVRDAYNQLSGQIRPQLTTVAGIDTGKFMDIVSNRMNFADQGISYYGPSSSSMLAMAGPDPTDDNRSTYETRPNFAIGNNEASFGDPKLSFWGKGYGVYGQRDNGGGVAGYDYNVYGSSFGLDYQVSDSSLMGITAGYSTSNIDSYLPGNEGDISGTHIGIYGTKNMDEWHVDSILTGSFLKFETERYVPLMDERVKGDYDGIGISGYVEARYDLQNQSSDSWLIQPLAAFQFSCLRLSEYAETGGENVALSPDDENYNSYKGSLGIKLTQQLFDRENKRNASVQLRARWIHEFGDDNSSVDSHFASDPGAVFKVSDEDMSRDSAVLGASFNAGLSRHTQFSLGYDTQLNSDNTMHVFSAMFAYRW
jgi:T5SS/PEP-CTERM-associated repeat protein